MLRAQRLSLWQYAGGSDCLTEENNLAACALNPPPFIPPPPVVVGPPPACPAGQHLTEGGQCHADHECGDDEIGGGSEECEPCGEGKVPDSAGSACVACPHGETFSGECDHACDITPMENAAANALRGIPRRPYEDGTAFYCQADSLGTAPWVRSPSTNACTISITMPYQNSCWTGTTLSQPCNLASLHTHPYFTKADQGTICHRLPMTENYAKDMNNSGMEFSPADINADYFQGVDGMLGVSDRSCVQANRVSSIGVAPAGAIDGSCTSVPLPHKKW